MNKRILSVALVAILAVALVLGGIVVSAADGVTTVDQIQKICENGGTLRLGANVGGDGNIYSNIVVAAGKTVVLDLNGYTITGVNITVKAGAKLTIEDNDVNKIGLITTGEGDRNIVLEAGTAADKPTVLNITGGTLKDRASAANIGGATITANDNTVVNISGGKIEPAAGRSAVNVNGDAVVNISGGEVGFVWNCNDKGEVNITGGTVTDMRIDNGAETTASGTGTLKGTVTVADGDLELDAGATLDKDASIVMNRQGGVYVDGATVNGKISGVGDLDIVAGYIAGTIEVDDANVTGGEFTVEAWENAKVENEVVLVDIKRTPVVKYDNNTKNSKGEVVTTTTYLVGAELIGEKVAAATSEYVKDTVYADQFTVLYDAKGLSLTVEHADIYVAYADKTPAKKTTVNGLALGSTLQVGGVFGAGKGEQPMHKWSAEVAATPYVCGEKVVLFAHKADDNNPGKYWATKNDKGEDQVNAEITVTYVDKDGNTFTNVRDGKPFGTKAVNPIIEKAAHLKNPVAFKAPTATENGVYQHYVCAVCDKCFTTFEDDFAVEPEQLVIPAFGTGTTTTPTDPTPTDPGKKPDEGGSDITTDPGKTGDVDNFAWVVCLAVSAIGAVAVAGSMVASKKYDR